MRKPRLRKGKQLSQDMIRKEEYWNVCLFPFLCRCYLLHFSTLLLFADKNFYFECFELSLFPFFLSFFLFSLLLFPTSIFLVSPMGKMPSQSSWKSYIPSECKKRPWGTMCPRDGGCSSRCSHTLPMALMQPKCCQHYLSLGLLSKVPSLHGQKLRSHQFVHPPMNSTKSKSSLKPSSG